MFETAVKLQVQWPLYSLWNEFSRNHTTLGRLAGIPVAMIDIAAETIKTPLNAIELIAQAALHLVGATLSLIGIQTKHQSFKKFINLTEQGLKDAISSPVVLLIAPLKLLKQINVNTSYPGYANTYCFNTLQDT